MTYRVEITRSAERALRLLSPSHRGRVARAMLALGGQPRPPGYRALKGSPGVYRIRVGTYRILYEIHDATVTIIVLKIGHRKAIYR